jgi:hypothetical protein
VLQSDDWKRSGRLAATKRDDHVSDRVLERLSVDRETGIHSGKCAKAIVETVDCGSRLSESGVMEADGELKKESRSP